MNSVHLKKSTFSALIIFLMFLIAPLQAFGQENPSGALDFGLNYHRSMGGRNVLGIHARAMAVDRVPGKLIGRYGELYGSLGVGLQGELVQYSVGLKLGVGLGTNHLVIFLATGIMSDGYVSIADESEKDNVSPGLGIPLALGIWVDPIPGLYFYAMAEPSWAFFGGERKTTPYIPFNWAWELRLRDGFGVDIASVHMRIDYTFHQVDPHPWHVISIGFGLSSKAMTEMGKLPEKK